MKAQTALKKLVSCWVLSAVAICIVSGVPGTCLGAEQTRILEQLTALAESAELALYLAKAAVLAPSDSETAINLEAVMTMFSGTSASDYPRTSMLAMIDGIQDSLVSAEFQDLLDIDLGSTFRSVTDFLTLAEAEAQAGIHADPGVVREFAQRTYAYLLAALGSDDSGFGLDGVRQMIKRVPDSVIRLAPGESIQDAVDRVMPGGTIYLSPGIYRLTAQLMIRKSLTLARELGSLDEVLLAGEAENDIVYVQFSPDETDTTVHILDIALSGGRHGINSSGSFSQARHQLTLTNVTITRCSTSGLFVPRGRVILDGCSIHGNGEFGIMIPGRASVEVRRSMISDNGSLDLAALPYRQIAGVLATSDAEIVIEESTIQGNAGTGIHVERDVILTLRTSKVSDNGQDGLQAWNEAVLRIESCLFLRNELMGIRLLNTECLGQGASDSPHKFTGSVEGWGNVVPGPTSANGNRQGGICPSASYGFLLDPTP